MQEFYGSLHTGIPKIDSVTRNRSIVSQGKRKEAQEVIFKN